MLTAAAVSGTFFQGFADVLEKASVPTSPQDFGKVLATMLLVLVPQLVQWLITRFTRKSKGKQLNELLNEMVASHLAGHQLGPVAPVKDAV